MTNYSQGLGYWVKRLHLLSNQAIDAELKPYGLGRTQWQIMNHLSEVAPLTQKHLQAELQIESATLTNLVASLVRKGLIAQASSTADRRSKELRLTTAGKRLYQAIPNPILKVRQIVLAGIPPEEIAQARAVLERAVENIESYKEQ